MASVTLNGISKRFGRVEALKALDLEIRDGEFMALLGPSGCGKTTTLNTIAGIETPTTGTVTIGDRDVTRVPAMRRDIAMVFQSYALYPHMTVAKNLAFALEVRRMSSPAIAAKVEQAAAMLDLGPYLDRYPRQLSGGQRQRVALGRALVRDPSVFLLDEPLSNLDAVLRVQTRAELVRLFQRLATTAVYVTHDQAEAMTMADRIAVFENGRLLQVGAPLDIYRNPVNRFVAGFVGSPPMTFVDTEVTGTGLKFGAAEIAASLPMRAGSKVTLGIRPEDVVPAAAGLPAGAEVVEHLGGLQILYLDVGGVPIAMQADADHIFRRGERLTVRIAPDRFYLFDPGSGQTLAAPGRPDPSTMTSASPSS
ncbi:ABC transporter ATP-binding protein [Bauldia litoralis]|uniref:ABC transporter ATP-binding protein n=2 Tax=Bauldia litoralis TaxID=665467 RepID=UPI003264C5D2